MVFHPPAPAESASQHKPGSIPAEPKLAPASAAADLPGKLTTLPQALSSYTQNIQPLPLEEVDTNDALNRCLAEAPVATTDLPGFTQSAVDGYALSSFDTSWASPAEPTRLKVVGEIAAGASKPDLLPLTNKMAYRILTGAPLPRGADAVIAQEYVSREQDDISIESPVSQNKNIRFAGEELRKGDALAAPGQRISPGMLAALMAAGAHKVKVFHRPRISVLITGDEVVPAGQTPAGGQVHDANAPMIRSWLHALGYPSPTITYVRDVRQDTRSRLHAALDDSDLVITTGGASVGTHDYMPEAATACGVRPVFWKVAQKPGKPIYFGMRGITPLLCLPGNPAAVLVGLVIHVRRVLDCLEGVGLPGPRMSAGRLLKAVAADASRDRLVRMNLSISAEGQLHLDPLPKQDSHMLSNLATAMALVMLPARTKEYAQDESVLWTPLPGVTRI